MKITISEQAQYSTQIVFIFEGSKPSIVDFEGKKEEISVRYNNENTKIYCGLGPKKNCTDEIVRSAAGVAIRKGADLKRSELSVIVPVLKRKGVRAAQAAVEGILLGSYTFTKYKSDNKTSIKKVEVVTKDLSLSAVKALAKIKEGVFLTRDLVNDNASVITPQKLAEEAKKIAAKNKQLSCTILSEKEIDKKGLGLLKAVGQGAPYPPRLIILQYKGNAKSKETTAIVGKGITFDSGGLNLKPSGYIETMRTDMAGAAAVLGTMKTIAALKPSINVIGVVAAAYNANDGDSYFPGDIYTSYSGKTVEIHNTDAEGRLVLADAISYCIKNYKPTEIVDLATLTGAIVIALGDMAAGLFSNNDSVAEKLAKAGDACNEKLWRMPLSEVHSDSMKGELADLRNMSKLPKRHAGSSAAAAFLMAFVEDTSWAHLDIAGVAFNDRESRGETPKFATGFGVRLLLTYLLGKSFGLA